MGRRSRKRRAAVPEELDGTATDDGAREQTAPEPPAPRRPARPRRPPTERPPAPWAPFPLVELCVLIAIVVGVIGFVTWGRQGQIMVGLAAALGSLAGLEIAIREHLAGWKSHTTVLAAFVAVIALGVMYFAAVPQLVMLPVAAVVFALALVAFRSLFKRRSGGVGFRG